MAATLSTSLRMTLIGQPPSPADSAQRIIVCIASAASTLALKKPSSVPLRDRLAAQFADALEPPGIAEKDEEHRRIADPGHGRETARRSRRALRVAHAQDRGLLEIRLGGRAERRGDQQIEQRFVRHVVAVAPHGLAREHPADEFVVFGAFPDGPPSPKRRSN